MDPDDADTLIAVSVATDPSTRLRALYADLHKGASKVNVVVADLDADGVTGALLAEALVVGSGRVHCLTFVRLRAFKAVSLAAFLTAMAPAWPALRHVVFDTCDIRAECELPFCRALDELVSHVASLGLLSLADCFSSWRPLLQAMCRLRQLDLSYSQLDLVAFLPLLFEAPNTGEPEPVRLQSLSLCGQGIWASALVVVVVFFLPRSFAVQSSRSSARTS